MYSEALKMENLNKKVSFFLKTCEGTKEPQ